MRNILLALAVFLAFAAFATSEKPKLIFVQQTFRHGARNPFKSMGIGDEYVEYQNKKGQLTKQGKSMHYLLGKKMKSLYWQKLFCQAPFNSNDFYVRSTDVNRTLQSAFSHLVGLLQDVPPLHISELQAPFSRPPYPGVRAKAGPLFGAHTKDVQPIPIHTMENYMSPCSAAEPLIRFMSYNCPYQQVWQKQNLKIPQYEEMLNNPKFFIMMEQLSLALGKKVTPSNFNSFYDSLESMRYRGKQVPPIFIDESPTSKLIHLYYSLRQSIIFYGNEQQLRASASDIIGETVQNMKNVISGSANARKWVLYSAHDITLGYMMNFLGLSNPHCIYQYFKGNIDESECVYQFPPYASVLVFELYRHEQGEPTFKLSFNGDYRKIPFCGGQRECNFSELEKWYQMWKVNDVRVLCMTKAKTEQIMAEIAHDMELQKNFPGENDL